jgi:hypothetical protein
MSLPFTAFVTKYALTDGIKRKLVEPFGDTEMVSTVGASYENFHGEGRDWHRTYDGALARAERMRSDKIASHKKYIAKLEKMTFTEPS